MNFLNYLEKSMLITNTKGGYYYESTYNCNLDLFSGLSRFNSDSQIIQKFNKAYAEDKTLALANLLYILDIREGKGERRIFKIIFKHLCSLNPADAKTILSFIASLGRYDYILEGLKTPLDDDVISLIKNQLSADLKSDSPSLLTKWMPSHRTHNKISYEAKYIANKLGITEAEYRKTLSAIRGKLNLVENNLTNKTYSNIRFDEVPSKAMLKYQNAFEVHMGDEFLKYKEGLKNGTSKINTKGLFCYEIVKKALRGQADTEILDSMWNSQKCITTGDKNILVVADTSGSMTCYDALPYYSSLGLAIYTAERNKGIFKDTFITFSDNPSLQKVIGNNIVEKIKNIKTINASTNIDKVFDLLLNTLINNNVPRSDLPSHIVIISDMEFDSNVKSQNGTNFYSWKMAFKSSGYTLPKIIFWNVALDTYGVPVTKNDKDCVMVSGFSTSVISKIFDLESYNPILGMLEVLKPYLKLLN